MPDRPPVRFPSRALDAHKGRCGDVLIVAGSTGMSGAAYLSGKACLRGGAGLVTIACPASTHAVLEVKTTCVMTRPLPETDTGSLGHAALDPLRALVRGRSAWAIGPGLSRHPETEDLVHALLSESGPEDPPVVIDADGLNAFEGRAGELRVLAGRAVLTPHPGEFRRLFGEGQGPGGEHGEREERLRAFVSELGVTTLLKGRHTLVASPGDAEQLRVYRNPTGNPGMATAGAGDVLTGLIAALLAQGLAPHEAACLGAYLHGRAGDIAARTRGWAPLIATDLLEGLVEAIRHEEARG